MNTRHAGHTHRSSDSLALASGASAKSAIAAVSDFRSNVTRDDILTISSGPPYLEVAQARVEYVEWLWNQVGRTYNALATSLLALQNTADSDLGAELDQVRGVRPEDAIPFGGLAIAAPLPGFVDSAYMYTVRRGERARN